MIRILINGFGRIGKTFLRTIMQDPQAKKQIEVVAINLGPGKKEDIALLYKYDTLMGTYQGSVSLEGDYLVVDGTKIKILAEMDPTKLPSGQLKIDWVVECTGHFTHREGAAKHLATGAKKVLISAPAKGEDISIIPGVNLDAYDKQKHAIVSLGSCTTNALVPTVHVINKHFQLVRSFMTTAHAYTNTQALLDVDIGDPRRNRAAALNIVPTSTGAQEMVIKIFPELKGLILAHAIRVPVGKVSLIDLWFETKKPISVQSINAAFEQEAQDNMKGIVGISDEPLVSSDYAGNSNSVTIDAELTNVIGNTGKVFGWYDNEWGYSERLKDFLLWKGE